MVLRHLRKQEKRARIAVKVYPQGIEIEAYLGDPEAFEDRPTRGVIEGFSNEAARRHKGSFMTLHAPGRQLWAYSLTVHRPLTAEQWRATVQRFRMKVKRATWAGIWRVELQRRKVPHLHVALWLPEGVTREDVSMLWLESTREQNDPEAWAHAVKGMKIEQGAAGWAVYMAMHAGKHKEEQLGWLGKQWGIWNAAALVERKAFEVELTARQHFQFLRWLRRLEWAEKRRHCARLFEKALRGSRGLGGRVDAYSYTAWMKENEWAAIRYRVLARRLKGHARPLHQGNLLRLMKGPTALRMLRILCK